MLDTTHRVETPEGVRIHLRVAGPMARGFAYFIDFLLRVGIYIIVAIGLSIFQSFGLGLFLIVIFVIEWFYPVLFEVFRNGKTPGKKWLKLQVLHEDGTPVSWRASILRNLIRFADFLPVFYGFGIVTSLLEPNFKRLGDLAAGTIVIYREPDYKPPELGGRIDPVRPPPNLRLEEQRAIVSFAERMNKLGVSRVHELASLLEPLTGTSDKEESVRLLRGYAAWLVGRETRPVTNRKGRAQVSGPPPPPPGTP